jgi:hypothetical protein
MGHHSALLTRVSRSIRFEMIHSKLERGLAGLQAGMFGGLALLAVMLLVSVLDRRQWWNYPNLVAGYFYGARSIGAGPGWHTVSGAALQLLIAGCAGALFGVLFGGLAASRRMSLLGLAWGVLTFFASGQFYRVFSPIVLRYMPGTAALVAHMIFGVCLSGIGRFGAGPAAARFGAVVAPQPLGEAGRPLLGGPWAGPSGTPAARNGEQPD